MWSLEGQAVDKGRWKQCVGKSSKKLETTLAPHTHIHIHTHTHCSLWGWISADITLTLTLVECVLRKWGTTVKVKIIAVPWKGVLQGETVSGGRSADQKQDNEQQNGSCSAANLQIFPSISPVDHSNQNLKRKYIQENVVIPSHYEILQSHHSLPLINLANIHISWNHTSLLKTIAKSHSALQLSCLHEKKMLMTQR